MNDLQSIFVTSPRLGTSGNLYFKTAQGKGSISAKAAASHPKGPNATDAASMPLNNEMNLMKPPIPR